MIRLSGALGAVVILALVATGADAKTRRHKRMYHRQVPINLLVPNWSDGSVRASWYERSSRTASGERFQPDGFTAAHRSLPFGTHVLVTNAVNGRAVTVRINDRGPFVRGRVLDLSRGAARALGVRRAGVARVRMQVMRSHTRRRFPYRSQHFGPAPNIALARLPSYLFGRLVCAINVNRALEARGIRGTGSAMAKSFLRWGKPSGPVPGAVAVFDRGGRRGHVAIVSRVVGRQVYLWNPGRHGWREVVARKRAIAYRAA